MNRVHFADAADVTRGPAASIGAPGQCVPVLLHSAWAPRAVSAPEDERVGFAEDVTPAHLAGLPDELATAVRQVGDGTVAST